MSVITKDFRNVLFVSRNEDNSWLNNSICQPFKPRTKSFVAEVSPFDVSSLYDEFYDEFETFVNEGINGEISRLYVSVNARDEQKVHRALIHELIDKPDFDMTKIDSKIASIAMKPVNRKTSHWLFDFDGRDFDLFYKFMTEVSEQTKILAQKPTMNGYALVVARGFDTREILKKYPMATLKRDSMLLSYWKAKKN